MTIRMGIIGCGALGCIHAQRFQEMADVDVAALADPDAEALEHAAGLLNTPGIRTEPDYRRIMEMKLDAVCIASPDGFHVRQTLDALSAGLHVLCEKPLTPHAEELEEVIRARDAAGRHVSLTYPRRYSAGIRAMRDEILSGRWGGVKAVSAYDCEDWVTPNVGTWRHDPTLCPGGFLYDANGHQIDTLFWVTGLAPEWARGSIDCHGTAVPISAWGTAGLTGGVPLTYHFYGAARRWREQVNIHCERMDFVLENGRALRAGEEGMEPVPSSYPDETADQAFVKLLEGTGPNWAPPDELWPVLRFTAAALAPPDD